MKGTDLVVSSGLAQVLELSLNEISRGVLQGEEKTEGTDARLEALTELDVGLAGRLEEEEGLGEEEVLWEAWKK